MNLSILRNHILLSALFVATSASMLCGQEDGTVTAAVAEAPVNAVAVEAVEAAEKVPTIEVCFVLDTTGSMSGLIQGAKDKIWSIANELSSTTPAPKIQFGLIGYRDRRDDYITTVNDLTDDLDAMHTKLMAFSAGGGGDTPESVNQSLHEAVTKMSWSNDDEVLKIIFLVGDAPPHMDYDEVQYPEICDLAMKKDLVINTIQCGSMSATTPIWQAIAAKSEGSYTAILQSGGVVAIKTPHDKEIAVLNAELNGTVINYGSAMDRKENQMKIDNNLASKAEAIADRAGFYSKARSGPSGSGSHGRAGKVIGGENDLIEQVMNDEIKLSEVDKSKLPTELQGLSLEEQKVLIDQKVSDRKMLQEKIDVLVKKRSKFIEAEKAKAAVDGEFDSFDMEVKKMIRAQGESKGIKFSK